MLFNEYGPALRLLTRHHPSECGFGITYDGIQYIPGKRLSPNSCNIVKLRIRMEMSGLKSCEALASTCRLRHSLDGCLEFWRSKRSRRVQSRAEKKLKADESELEEVGC